MRLITWNINRAAYTRVNLWNYLTETQFDIGLFQEVYMFPHFMKEAYHVIRGEMNAILVKRSFSRPEVLVPFQEGLPPALRDFCISAIVKFKHTQIHIISVYNYIGPDARTFGEFLEKLIQFVERGKTRPIIGGDFNVDERFHGKYRGWGRLARTLCDELRRLGYVEALRWKLGENAYTFLSKVGAKPYQLDYLFIPVEIKIKRVFIGETRKIFDPRPRVSDHLPIIADIEVL